MKATRYLGIAVLVFGATVGTARAQLHGAGILKSCEPCKTVGEITNCLIQVRNIDGFGDTLIVKQGFDTVASGGGPVRVPASGNLPIIAVSGTTTCTVGGSLPCDIGPSAAVTFRSNEYVIQPTDSTALSDTGRVVVQDKCNIPAGQGNCSTIDATLPFSAQTTVCIEDGNECTDDACIGANEASETCQHPNKADSTTCTDTDGNACTTAGCEAGACVQTHTVTVCPPDSNECTDDLPCDTATGACNHPNKADSTPCTDTDANTCTTAGCDAGVCNQSHIVCVTTTTVTTTTTGSTTTSTTLCVPTPENTSEACGNMVDDDCDMLIDCADPDCIDIFPCPPAKKDPTIIRFGREGSLGLLRGHAKLEMAPVDLGAMPVSVLLTNPNGVIYEGGLPAGALTTTNGTIFRYQNSAARFDGGIYKLKIKKNSDRVSYTFSFSSYADLSAATDPGMRLQFYIGDDENVARDGRNFITIDTPWTRTPRGWRAPKDH